MVDLVRRLLAVVFVVGLAGWGLGSGVLGQAAGVASVALGVTVVAPPLWQPARTRLRTRRPGVVPAARGAAAMAAALTRRHGIEGAAVVLLGGGPGTEADGGLHDRPDGEAGDGPHDKPGGGPHDKPGDGPHDRPRSGGADWGSAGRSGRRGLAIGPGTRFEIGSVTKLFTALLLADLVVAGELALDDPLARFLPALDGAPAGRVTLRSLATHTSGLPRLPGTARWPLMGMTDPYRGLGHRWLIRAASRTVPGRPGTVVYSNFGYLLLGEALAAACGQSWADLVRQRICGVLGMDATSVTPDRRTARGHDGAGLPTPYWSMSALPGAGALYSTTEDLRRFLQAQLDPGATPLREAILLSRRPHAPGVGLGWMLAQDGIAWHNGGTGGFGAFVAVRGREVAAVPRGGVRAVAVLTNTMHQDGLDALALRVLRDEAASG